MHSSGGLEGAAPVANGRRLLSKRHYDRGPITLTAPALGRAVTSIVPAGGTFYAHLSTRRRLRYEGIGTITGGVDTHSVADRENCSY
jgi:hypothetical protein